MIAIERLKRDHAIFRMKLDVLESALSMGMESRFVIREMCFTLSRQLRDHIRREGRQVVICNMTLGKIGPEELARFALDHREEWSALRYVNRLLEKGSWKVLMSASTTIDKFASSLRDRMQQQETQLFPFLVQVVGRQQQEDVMSQPVVSSDVSETMRADHVIERYPQTRAVFERFFIDVEQEGYYSLDELAWRHGLKSETLLTFLDKALTSSARVRHQPANHHRHRLASVP